MDKKRSRSESAQRRMAKRWAGRDEYWRDLIMRQQDSELGIGDFCEQEGVHATSFYVWRKKLGIVSKQKGKPRKLNGQRALQSTCARNDSFIKIEVEAMAEHSGVIVELPDNIRIILSKDFDQEVLRQAVQAMRSIEL